MLRHVLLTLFVLLAVLHAQDDDDIVGEHDLPGAEQIDVNFDVDQMTKIDSSQETSDFQAEVNRLMEIIVNSLYKTRDIFLRELVSNAVDALDKIRFQSLKDKNMLGDKHQLDIRIQADPDAGTLTIIDTGIGMTKQQLADNLGKIAYSGSAQFIDAMSQAGETGENPLALIGQFGVGFYSAFLVADEVMVVSKSNEEAKQHIWRSRADGKFNIAEDPRGDTLGRGTAIILKIKEDAKDFLDPATIETTVQRYSEFTHYPIYLFSTDVQEEEVDSDTTTDEDGDELSTEDEDVEKKKKTIEKVVHFWKRLNAVQPIWTRSKTSVTDEEYDKFYEGFSKDANPPLAHTHFKAEGELEFDSILFIPSKSPFGFYDNYYNAKSKLKLFVRRVLVADEFEDIIPKYLNFVKGLVDSNDLPLNVNREDLQKNKVMRLISRKLTRKVLDLLRKMAKEDEEAEEEAEGEDDEEEDKAPKSDSKETRYATFWKEFGKSLKLGVLEDKKNMNRLVELLRFTSTRSPETPVSLRSYVEHMKPGQKYIYYISAGSIDEAENSPFLERFKRKGYEVLYFVDPLDEYMQLKDYDDIELQSVSKDNVELDGAKMKEFLKEKEKEFEDLKTWLKDLYGSNKINKVQISSTLDKSPMAIATTQWGSSARMEQIQKSQAFGSQASQYMRATKVLQLNYRHPIIIYMKDQVDEGVDDDKLKDLAKLMLDGALIQSGFSLESDEQQDMSTRIERIVRSGLGISADAELEPEPEFADEVGEEGEEDEEYEDYDDEEDIDDEEDKEEL